MPAEKLSLDQVKELRSACLDNAERLLADARLLVENDRWPSAYETAYFCREEAAKSAVLYAVAHLLATKREVKWEAFWRAWRSHQEKSRGFVMMGQLHEQVFELGHGSDDLLEYDREAEAKEAARLRQEREEALYVDWSQGVKTPWDAIAEGRARQMIADAERAVAAANDLAAELICPRE